ncbi:2-hydroxychromene-2-carboxylate isomerase [Thioclava sp. GXIMD2076]|uniref:2-hydroxychromene-2-carboxylate isomerase n=1 Tax=Thioclava kandeliae TaxID=3070818 RepID=A0ABV1SCN1_9RHOB
MSHIDYYFSIFSPYTYLAGLRLEEIARRHGAGVTYRPLDLMALFDRTGGTRPAARHPSRMEYRNQEVTRWAEKLGMPMPDISVPLPNAAPASYAIIAAQKAGGGDLGGLVHAIARARWAEGRDIGEEDLIRAALVENGFDGNLVTTGLFDGAIAYEKNLEDAVAAGVFGSPFYIVTDTDARFFGQDRLEFLDAHLGTLS